MCPTFIPKPRTDPYLSLTVKIPPELMKPKIASILQHRKFRYIFIGISVYIFELLVIVIAQSFHASAIIAVSLSFWLGLVVSFCLQKLITFKDTRLHHKVLLPQIIASLLLVGFNFSFTILVTHMLRTIVPATLCRTLALGASTIWNYYLYKTHIFSTTINT